MTEQQLTASNIMLEVLLSPTHFNTKQHHARHRRKCCGQLLNASSNMASFVWDAKLRQRGVRVYQAQLETLLW